MLFDKNKENEDLVDYHLKYSCQVSLGGAREAATAQVPKLKWIQVEFNNQ